MNAIAPEPGSREQIIAELTPLVSAYIVGKKKVPVRVATVRRIIEQLKKPIGVEA